MNLENISIIKEAFEKEWHGIQISLIAAFDEKLNRYSALNPNHFDTVGDLNLSFSYFLQGWRAKERSLK